MFIPYVFRIMSNGGPISDPILQRALVFGIWTLESVDLIIPLFSPILLGYCQKNYDLKSDIY